MYFASSRFLQSYAPIDNGDCMADNSTVALTDAIQHLNYADSFRAITILLIGWLLAKGARLFVARVLGKRFHAGDLITIQRIIYYVVLILFLISALRQIGFNLEVLLGAAGIFTVALGFASQTSASNLISGLFLLAERPFLVGDVITVNGVTGKVLSIDLLSTKITMADNTYVRIPNELLIKSQIANISRFEVRRIDISLVISANADLEQAETILLDIVNNEPLALKDPKPFIKNSELYSYGVKIELLAWCNLADGDVMKNSLITAIKRRFRENQIQLGSDKSFLILGNEHVNRDA